jgi:3-oxoacyl-[acyl-carrier-protein] synthase-3
VKLKVFRPAALGRGVRLAATGAYLPARRVDNAALRALGVPLTEEEIVKLTGVLARRWAAPEEATSDLAVQACRQALARAGVAPAEVDRLIVATVSPDHASPSAACFAQAALGLGQAPAFDVTASCSGFLYALDLAARSVCTGDARVLACAADVRSRFLDLSDRATAALFGDGAGAALVTDGAPGEGLLAVGLLADGAGARAVHVPAGGSREPATAATVAARRHTIQMAQGPQVYLAAVEGMVEVGRALLDACGLTLADVDLVVPHQPNLRILDRYARLSGLGLERLFVQVQETGNVSGASCALALDAALRSDRVRPGMRVLLVAAGAGYTAGAALLKLDDALIQAASRT